MSTSVGPSLCSFQRLSLFTLVAFVTLSCEFAAPVQGERLWLDLHRIELSDVTGNEGKVPPPPPILLGCRFPGCFPGYLPGQTLTLEATAQGPFLKHWALGLEELSPDERKSLTLAGEAKEIPPAAIQLGCVAAFRGCVAKVEGLRPEHGDRLPRITISVDLDLASLGYWAAGKGPLLAERPQLLLEVRQVVGGIEVDRWRFIYDFSTLLSAESVPAPATIQDRIELKGYSSPVTLLLAYGSDLAQRRTEIRTVQSALDVDNMNQSTPNVEIAIWAYDHQPLLHLTPNLTAGSDVILEKAPGLLTPTPNLRLPSGEPASGVEWKDLARCDYAVANQLFRRNRMGIELQFMVGGASVTKLCDGTAALMQQKEFSAGSLNIFYLAEDQDPQNCCLELLPQAMFITNRATPTTLAHELGHSFGLWHDKNSGNIMQGGALDRSEFTLPQVYLMVFGGESTLNLLTLRQPPTRTKTECPAHCRPDVPVNFMHQCVKPDVGFSTPGSPHPTGPIQELLMALSSDESAAAPLPESKDLASLPGLVPFLANVVQSGPRLDPISDKIKRIRALLNDQECQVSADVYVELYGSRVVANAQWVAADALFMLRTAQAKSALETVKQFSTENLKKHIEGLLFTW